MNLLFRFLFLLLFYTPDLLLNRFRPRSWHDANETERRHWDRWDGYMEQGNRLLWADYDGHRWRDIFAD